MRTLLAGAAAVILLGGAVPAAPAAYTSPRALPASPVLPDAFRNAPDAAPGEAVPLAEDWWKSFGDPVLDRMVETALAGNLDIAAAAARLEQAAAGLKAAQGALLPQASLDGSGGIKRQSTEDVQGRAFSKFPGFQRTVEQYGLNGAASWELDLFGKLAADARAARAEAGAADAGLAAARLTIAAEVVNTYIDVRAIEARLAVARARVAAARETDTLLRQRAERGVAALTETDRSGAELAGAQSAVPALETALEVMRNRLDVLMGRAPGQVAEELAIGAGAGGIPAVRAPAGAAGSCSARVSLAGGGCSQGPFSARPNVCVTAAMYGGSDTRGLSAPSKATR